MLQGFREDVVPARFQGRQRITDHRQTSQRTQGYTVCRCQGRPSGRDTEKHFPINNTDTPTGDHAISGQPTGPKGNGRRDTRPRQL